MMATHNAIILNVHDSIMDGTHDSSIDIHLYAIMNIYTFKEYP